MHDLAPGNILQALHFQRRLRVLERELGRVPRFVEVGAGTGWLSEIALAEGCSGTGYDLNPICCETSRRRNAAAVASGRYRILNEPFSGERSSAEKSVDLVFSCMLLEHLTDEEIGDLIAAARRVCRPDGVFAAFVPSGMRYWGIEDEVAGHLRRYEREDLRALTRQEGLRTRYWTGLTFPISNLLRGVSNWLVARGESAMLQESQRERTIAAGYRDVPFKTRFPWWTRCVLNRGVLWPFDLLQRFFGRSSRAMVLYWEWDLFPEELLRR